MYGVYAEDVVIRDAVSLPYGGEYRGHQGVIDHGVGYVTTWDAVQEQGDDALDPEFLDCGDQVVVRWTQRGRTPDGELREWPAMSAYRIRDGRIAEAQMLHSDTADIVRLLNAHEPAGPNKRWATPYSTYCPSRDPRRRPRFCGYPGAGSIVEHPREAEAPAWLVIGIPSAQSDRAAAKAVRDCFGRGASVREAHSNTPAPPGETKAQPRVRVTPLRRPVRESRAPRRRRSLSWATDTPVAGRWSFRGSRRRASVSWALCSSAAPTVCRLRPPLEAYPGAAPATRGSLSTMTPVQRCRGSIVHAVREPHGRHATSVQWQRVAARREPEG